MYNLSGMSLLSMGAIGAGVAALTAGWSQVKGLWDRAIGVVMVTNTLKDRLSMAALYYCDTKMKRAWTPFRFFSGYIDFVKPKDCHQTIAYEELGNKVTLFWLGWKPVWVSQTNDAMTLRFLRKTLDSEKLIMDILDTWTGVEFYKGTRFAVHRLSGKSGKDLFDMSGMTSKSDESDTAILSPTAKGTFKCYFGRILGYSAKDIGETEVSGNPLERISVSPEIQEAIDEVKRWFNSRQWYKDRKIPWRRGLLLTGKPGTGKSSLAKAMAQDLEIPIYLMDIATMDNQEFYKSWKQALSNTPAMVVIEDIDSVFNKRVNIVAEKSQGLSFDCLLNTISGVEASDGILLVITTNHLDKLDEALGVSVDGSPVSTRPGRIDRVIHMGTLDHDGRVKMATRIMSGCNPSLVDNMVLAGVNDTGAQFEDRCAQEALKAYWSVKNHDQTCNYIQISCHVSPVKEEV